MQGDATITAKTPVKKDPVILLLEPTPPYLVKDDPIFNNTDLKIGLSWKSVVSVYGRLKSLNLEDFKPLIKKNRQFIY